MKHCQLKYAYTVFIFINIIYNFEYNMNIFLDNSGKYV